MGYNVYDIGNIGGLWYKKLKLKVVIIFLHDLKLLSFFKMKCRMKKHLYILKKFIFIQKEFTQIILFVGIILNNFKNMLQKYVLQNSFLWKSQNVHNRPICGK
jgi:hypothetical protein